MIFSRTPPDAPGRVNRVPVVYTMGKVASSSVTEAIRRNGRQVYDIHSLRADKLRTRAQSYLDRGAFPTAWVCEAMAWRDSLLAQPRLCFYITLVREPIGRNLSAFFQNLEINAGPSALSKSPEELLDIFINSYPHTYVHRWFDLEFHGELGIDVYSERFDHAARFARLSAAPALVFRVDCDDATKGRQISKALGFTVEVGRSNDGSVKAYADKYAEFKRSARFPADFLDHAYGTKYSKHFWSEDELAAYRKVWSNRP